MKYLFFIAKINLSIRNNIWKKKNKKKLSEKTNDKFFQLYERK